MIATLVTGLTDVADSCGGLLLVALFFWFRFHSLKGTRSYTTRASYYFGMAVFLLPFILAYGALTINDLSSLAAIWVLIVVWGLTPVLPGMWRKLCHDLAQIPTYAHRLRDMLAVAPFEVPPADMTIIRRQLGRFGYQVDDFSAVQRTAIQSRFLKIAALMHALEQWSAKREAFMKRNAEVYVDLLGVFDLLCLKVNRTLRNTAAIYGAIMEESKVQPDDWHALDTLAAQGDSANRLQSAAQATAGCMLEDLRKDMDFLLDKLLLFVARATLAGERNFVRRRRRLEAIGFTIPPKASTITSTIFKAVAITFFFTLIWFLFSGDRIVASGDQQDKVVIQTLTLPPLILVVNFLVVYHFKRYYAFASEGLFGGYPIRFILSIGFLTALGTLPFRVLFDKFLYSGPVLASALIGEVPLSIYSWAIGAIIALLVQDSMWRRFKSERLQQLMDGIAFGASMALAVAALLMIDQFGSIPQMHNWSLTFIESLGWTFTFGIVIGYLVIARLRQASSLFHARSRAAPSGALLPA
jgi:uncharacterized protein YjeT (DUF2065 family)